MRHNIKQNYTRNIDSKLYGERYYDFMLYKGEVANQSLSDLEDMAIADFSSLHIVNGILYSTVLWSGATNGGVKMDNIGFTGMDNGLIRFKKDEITNEEFLKLYLDSHYEIASGDTRLFLSPVTGNTMLHDYPMYLMEGGKDRYIAFKGGFYQGFFKLEGHDYQVLPNYLGEDWMMHFEIRPRSDYKVEERTVNNLHPENSGIFFFMGTRAENKFWPFYKTDSATTETLKRLTPLDEGYVNGCGESGSSNVVFEEWLMDEPKESNGNGAQYSHNADGYFVFDKDIADALSSQTDTIVVQKDKDGLIGGGINFLNTYDFRYGYCECRDCDAKDDDCDGDCDDYVADGTQNGCPDFNGSKFVEDDYVGHDAKINPDGYEDSEGHLPDKHGYYEIESDNKFLMFDRTPSGFTTDTWVEGTTVTLEGRKDWPNANYFMLMNRTDTGYTVQNIDQYNEANAYDFNIYKDVRDNVFALRVTDKGAIGYRYGVLNCDDDNENRYEVKEEYSKDGMVKMDEWNSINVRFVVMPPSSSKCDTRLRKMKIMIYVNGFLKFISKELDAFRFKALDEVSQKQEAVPYNISLGGGSQGLLETILPDYYALSDYVLPIERDFCGTFLGDIKSFKMYEGVINYSAINNYLS